MSLLNEEWTVVPTMDYHEFVTNNLKVGSSPLISAEQQPEHPMLPDKVADLVKQMKEQEVFKKLAGQMNDQIENEQYGTNLNDQQRRAAERLWRMRRNNGSKKI